MEAVLAPPRRQKAYTIEFWRFVFTVLVAVYHLEIFFPKQVVLPSSSDAVEFFFIVAGFLMAMSARRYQSGHLGPVAVGDASREAFSYAKKKFRNIYPILAIAILLGVLVYPAFASSFGARIQALMNTEWDWLMLINSPFGFADGYCLIIPIWFLTPLIICGYVYTYALTRHFDFMKFAAPVIGILTYIFFSLNSQIVFDHIVPIGPFTAGTVRAIAEMSLGISLYFIYEYLTSRKLSVVARILLSLLEVYAIYRLFALTFYQPVGPDNFRRIVYVLIIVLLAFSNVTYFSRIMNRRFWKWFGYITLAMFIDHYNLITLYFRILPKLKLRLGSLQRSSGLAKALYKFLQGTGGYDQNMRPSGMTWKDALLFILLVVIVSILIMLFIAGVRKFVVKPVKTRLEQKQAHGDPEPQAT